MFGPLRTAWTRTRSTAPWDTPYDIVNRRIEYAEAEPRALRVGWWRGVAPNNTIFAGESLVDELAKKAGKDPVAFRLAHLNKSRRLKAALQLARRNRIGANQLPRSPRTGRLRPIRVRHLYGHRGGSLGGQ